MAVLREAGRRMLFWGALFLILWAAWELLIRIDAMIKPIRMFIRMAIGERIPLERVLNNYVDWSILEVPFFLLGCVVLGLLAFLNRKRALMGFALIPLSVLAMYYSSGKTALLAPSFWQMLKLLPLLMVAAGSLIGLIFHFVIRARKKKARPTAAPKGQWFTR